MKAVPKLSFNPIPKPSEIRSRARLPNKWEEKKLLELPVYEFENIVNRYVALERRNAKKRTTE